MRVFVFSFILVCACSHSDLINQPKQQDTNRDILASIVPVMAHALGDRFTGYGTGFFVHPGLVVTAYHVVDRVDQLGGTIALMRSPSKPFQVFKAFIVAADPEKDLAILYTGAVAMPPLTLCPREDPHLAVAVRAIATKYDVMYKFFEGVALSGADKDDFLSNEVEAGTSGGPCVVYGHNCVSGVVIYSYVGSGVSGFVKAQEVIDLIDKNERDIKSKIRKLSTLF